MTQGHLLLVDPNTDLANEVRRAVESTFDITVLDSLARAVELVALGGIDVLITEATLPDGNGLELLREVQAGPHGRQTPVLCLTSHPKTAEAVQFIRSGGTDYIERLPAELEKLEQRLTDTLRWSRLDRAVMLAREEQQLVERRLRILQESLVSAERIALLGNWYWTPDGTSVWSDGLYHILGFAPGSVPPTTTTLLSRVHADDVVALESHLTQSRPSRGWAKNDALLHFRIVLPDGTMRHLQTTAGASSNEHTTGGSLVFQDVTASRHSRDELVRAKEHAESASRSKADFLARMSHEIRTPMNSILGMTDLVLDTSLTDEQREYIEMANGSAKSLLRLLNDILDFSKMEAGRLEMEQVEFELGAVAGQALRGLAERASAKQIELILEISNKLPLRVVGDALRLQQVLLNLVANALKFTTEGEIVVFLQGQVLNDNEQEIHCIVSDTGAGIPPAKQSLIFEAFSQADESVTRKFGGTGLGLTICAQLISLMGGRIWVESTEGKGSRFHFTARFGRPPQAAPREISFPLLDQRVLVVDDNERIGIAIRSILESFGALVTVTTTPEVAVTHATKARRENSPFSAILVDETLPGQAERLLELLVEENGPARTVLLSQKIRRSAHGLARRADVRLPKPIIPTALHDALLGPIPHGVPDSSSLRPPPTTAHQRLRVLVAEDNLMNQIVVRTILDRMGHDVHVVENGSLALDVLLIDDGFDLVLMDLQMPVLGGLEAVRILRLREKGGKRHLPVVALTAQALAEDRDACFAAGMDAYLTKPLHRKSIEDTLAALTGDRAPISSPLPAVDEKALEQRIGASAEILEQLANLFERDAPKLMDSVAVALETFPSDKKDRSLHTLKGMLQNVCASRGARLAKDLEEIVQGTRVAEAPPILAALQVEVGRVGSALRACARGAHSARTHP